MFYSQDILQRRGGQFGRIWLAATKPSQLRKRDYYSVNIIKTCDDLLAYILHDDRRGKRLYDIRFSLYLSAMLTNGVVKVYQKQCYYLQSDALSLSQRFSSSVLYTTGIDLVPHRQTQVDEPLNLEMLELGYPEFGQLDEADEPDWRAIPDMVHPVLPFLSVCLNLCRKSFHIYPAVIESPQLQADRESITLQDHDTSKELLQLPEGEDLPPMDVQQLDELEQSFTTKPTEDEEIFDKDVNLAERLDVGRLEPAEVTPFEFADTDLPLEPPALTRTAHSPAYTPAPAHSVTRKEGKRKLYELELPLFSEEQQPRSRRRRTQQLLIDSDITLSKEQIREQISNHHLTCKPMVIAYEPSKTGQNLLENPATKGFLKSKLKKLWKRNAVCTDFNETDSVYGRVIWDRREMSSSGGSSIGSEKGTTKHVGRDMEEPTVSPVASVLRLRGTVATLETPEISHVSHTNITGDSVLAQSRDHTPSILKESGQRPSSRQSAGSSFDKDATGVGIIITEPEELGTLHEVSGEQTVSPHAVQSFDIPSFELETESVSKPKRGGSTVSQEFIRCVANATEQTGRTTFRDICPLTKTRKEAAKMFSQLLEFARQQKVTARQAGPYGTITIKRGSHW